MLPITGINMKLGVLANHDKEQLLDKGHNSESHIVGVMPFSELIFLNRLALTPHAVLLLSKVESDIK
jgi:hypothetical protein